jgi:hypothetical protein
MTANLPLALFLANCSGVRLATPRLPGPVFFFFRALPSSPAAGEPTTLAASASRLTPAPSSPTGAGLCTGPAPAPGVSGPGLIGARQDKGRERRDQKGGTPFPLRACDSGLGSCDMRVCVEREAEKKKKRDAAPAAWGVRDIHPRPQRVEREGNKETIVNHDRALSFLGLVR